jgi:hypothetical protein
MAIRILFFAPVLFLIGLPATARADFIEYDLGALGKVIASLAGSSNKSVDVTVERDDNGLLFGVRETKITLPGKAVVQAGGFLSYTHPNGTTVHFKLEEVKHIKAPTTKEEFNKMHTRAGRDPEVLMKAGIWALKKGLLNELYKCVDEVLKIDPKHEAALKVRELRKSMKEPLPDDAETRAAEEKEFKSKVKRAGMRFERSNHFILMTDTPTKAAKGKKPRAQQRLDLLEKVYESFLLLFHAQDVQLDIPKERLMVVLFHKYDDFHEFSQAISPSLASAAGFWEPHRNVSYFYDAGGDPTFTMLEQLMKEVREEEKDAKKWRNNPDAIRYAKVLELILDVERENKDITVVSHECTHHMAGNTGLFPRHVDTPSWMHEGLASYFENPRDGTWAGIGAVSGRRIQAYRTLSKNDRVHSNINFIIRDEIFDLAGSNSSIEHAYAQAWALTHFMIENHLKEFVEYYRIMGDLPPDVKLSPEVLQSVFTRVFGSDLTFLDSEWRNYMNGLKTDIERLEADADS